MNEIITFALEQAYPYKTTKSIYNIITGKKSHQTLFDACSQRLMSLYHVMPNLKYPSFERILAEKGKDSNYQTDVILQSKFTYDSMVHTFKALQLMTQTISFHLNGTYQFFPITEHKDIQQRVKILFHKIKEEALIEHYILELEQLFSALSESSLKNVLHYYLIGYEESMYTSHQVSLIEDIPLEQLKIYEFNELIQLVSTINNPDKYPLLSQLVMLPTLSRNTYKTYKLLKHKKTFQDIAAYQNIKLSTLEDHVLELFIKGYFTDYLHFVTYDNMTHFISFYNDNKHLRLKMFKEKFSSLTYFQIKLMIVGIERGDLRVTSSA
ncbi:helix-turn-helix domain-containing protein [Staphylococcus sp. SQ8-PEA]|uniref:Helix-turn-helix domain-containing protein n=1 Tax=Staphylococcus marylandisciuri TaxID=2981529 RepID=A0ABT2QNB3_9STAP|nr:helix-turn-helix domain-containing protein [Staphylococcus marylandisciuri]MCU5745469.1 helix-turn-helix domain-containing protein [Staphylococcus marylandisciuri]